jgi:hypothetical protein
VLIQWEHGDIPENTWEKYTEIQQNYPLFNLEDKITFIGGGIVMKNTAGRKNLVTGDSANSVATNSQELGVRKGNRARVPSTRLRGYI